MDYLDRLSAFVEAVSLDRLPEEAVQAARLVLLDTIGAMVAGSAQPENRRLAAALHERRSRAGATLVGHGGRVDPLLATFANATAGVALEVALANAASSGSTRPPWPTRSAPARDRRSCRAAASRRFSGWALPATMAPIVSEQHQARRLDRLLRQAIEAHRLDERGKARSR